MSAVIMTEERWEQQFNNVSQEWRDTQSKELGLFLLSIFCLSVYQKIIIYIYLDLEYYYRLPISNCAVQIIVIRIFWRLSYATNIEIKSILGK